MTDDKAFPKGIFFNPPKEGRPEFVRGSISFKLPDAIEWLKENVNDKSYVNVDILVSREGKMYLKHNDFKPKSDLTEGF